MFKWGDLYWINEILLIGYFELKTIVNERITSNGIMGSLKAPFPQPRWLLPIH